MSIYVVMAPPEAEGPVADDSTKERLVFLRDGFSWGALVFSALWMLFHRMWTVFLGYLVLSLVIEAVSFGAGSYTSSILAVCVALLLGLEGSTLRQWSLERKGWQAIGLVNASSLEEAETRFFLTWNGRIGPDEERTRVAAARGFSGLKPRMSSEHVIGLPLGQETH